MLQHKYNLSQHEDVITSVRKSEQDFHKSHAPLYANYLFCNSFVMNKITNWLINCPEGTCIHVFSVSEKDTERFNDNAFICGMELVNGKVDFEANNQIAQHSKNAFVYSLDALNEDELFLVRDESLSNNSFLLKYITDSDDDDMKTLENSPLEKEKQFTCNLL